VGKPSRDRQLPALPREELDAIRAGLSRKAATATALMLEARCHQQQLAGTRAEEGEWLDT
jgi:hypothetical protein